MKVTDEILIKPFSKMKHTHVDEKVRVAAEQTETLMKQAEEFETLFCEALEAKNFVNAERLKDFIYATRDAIYAARIYVAACAHVTVDEHAEALTTAQRAYINAFRTGAPDKTVSRLRSELIRIANAQTVLPPITLSDESRIETLSDEYVILQSVVATLEDALASALVAGRTEDATEIEARLRDARKILLQTPVTTGKHGDHSSKTVPDAVADFVDNVATDRLDTLKKSLDASGSVDKTSVRVNIDRLTDEQRAALSRSMLRVADDTGTRTLTDEGLSTTNETVSHPTLGNFDASAAAKADTGAKGLAETGAKASTDEPAEHQASTDEVDDEVDDDITN